MRAGWAKEMDATKEGDALRLSRLPPFAIAGGYLLYKGYLENDSNGSSTSASRGLRIFPTAGASAGGVMAEFDF